MTVVSVTHCSDVLCVWAYVGQIKVDELHKHFGNRVAIETRFVPVFGNTSARLEAWKDRGGREGYARHVREVAAGFDHVEVHEDAWSRIVPAGSWQPHAFLRAAALVVSDGEGPAAGAVPGPGAVEELAWHARLAFFRDARDIGRIEVLAEVAQECGWSPQAIRRRLEDGSALAALADDHDYCSRSHVTGSPTFLFNEGRQQLYGNVGYRIIEANVEELLRDNADRASWC